MASPNLLITGVTGFIGFKVLLDALKEGYSVRAAIRSASQSDHLLSHSKLKALAPGNKLSFVEVPDLSRADACIRGITYVIHIASPLPSTFLEPQTSIYEPAIAGATDMLRSAFNEPSLKKLVITSSGLGNMPFPPGLPKEVTAETRQPDFQGPFNNMVSAYWGSKTNALNLTDRFVKENNPSFAVVNIFPGFVFGPDDKALSVEDITAGTNKVIFPIITGESLDNPLPSGAAHVYDVAKAYLLALKDGVFGNFGVTSSHTFQDAWDVVKKHFPRAVESGVFTQGHQPTVPVNWNAHSTEVEFGFTFKTYEDIVVDVASQYLEFSGAEKA